MSQLRGISSRGRKVVQADRRELCMANSQILEPSEDFAIFGWARESVRATICAARDLVVLFAHLLATVARLAGPGGACSVMAESVFVSNRFEITLVQKGVRR